MSQYIYNELLFYCYNRKLTIVHTDIKKHLNKGSAVTHDDNGRPYELQWNNRICKWEIKY